MPRRGGVPDSGTLQDMGVVDQPCGIIAGGILEHEVDLAVAIDVSDLRQLEAPTGIADRAAATMLAPSRSQLA